MKQISIKVIWVAIVALFCTYFSLAFAADEVSKISWHDYSDKLFVKSEKDKMPILLFVKADWCPHCTKMKETTLQDPAVVKLINESFIPVMIDADANRDLAVKYKVVGLPDFIILDSNKKVIKEFSGEMTIIDFLSNLSQAHKAYQEHTS